MVINIIYIITNPTTKFWEGNVFSLVCLSVHRGSHVTITHDALDLTIQRSPLSSFITLLFPYPYCQRRVLGSRGLLVVYVFIFYQTLRVVPHGTKGTGPRFVTRPAYLRSQFRNNTNTVSTLVPLIHLLQILCTRYASVAHHRALQTSGRGWADSKAVHRMECSGARSLYWRSLSVGAAT